jgi:hypothetical protein
MRVNALFNLGEYLIPTNDLSPAEAMRETRYGEPRPRWQQIDTPHRAWAPAPLAREVVSVLILTPLTPLAVMFLVNIAQGFQLAGAPGHFDLLKFVMVAALTSVMSVFVGFWESLLGSIAIVAIGRILTRFRLDSVWVSLIVGTVVGLTVPDAPSVLLGIAEGKSWQDAIADRTWRGFWPLFGIVAALMSLLNWRFTIQSGRRERLAQEQAVIAGSQAE